MGICTSVTLQGHQGSAHESKTMVDKYWQTDRQTDEDYNGVLNPWVVENSWLLLGSVAPIYSMFVRHVMRQGLPT